MIRVALDAMGGDFAPREVVAGAVAAARDFRDVRLVLVGNEADIRTELHRHGSVPQAALSVAHASESIGMGEHGAEAVRRKRRSSINVAVRLVADGQADAVVSAGNTAAMVAAATLFLRTLPSVRRAGIAVTLPTRTGACLLIDAGANIYCKPEHLYQYALMASVFAREVLGKSRPAVGVLNVGAEEEKGTPLVSEAAALLKEGPVDYRGFAEGGDLWTGKFDVVVCEGFVGNTILKVSEGLAESLMNEMRKHLTANPFIALAARMVKPAFRRIREQTDYAEYGGAPLLGVNGVAIIAHGRSNARAIRNAVRVAREGVARGVNARIVEALAAYAGKR